MRVRTAVTVLSALIVMFGILFGTLHQSVEYRAEYRSRSYDCGSPFHPETPTAHHPGPLADGVHGPNTKLEALCGPARKVWLPWLIIAVGVVVGAGAPFVDGDRTGRTPRHIDAIW